MSVLQTVREYVEACRQTPTRGRALFRGQTKDYGEVVPSLFRGNVERAANAHDAIVELYMEVYRLGWQTLKEARDRELEESYGTPVSMVSLGDWAPNWDDWEELFDPDRAIVGGPGLNYTRDDFIAGLTTSFRDNFECHADALLQHYGVPSRALDVAFHPLVALWFATHPYKVEPDGRAVHVEEMESEGIVYVFDSATAPGLEDLRRVHSHPYDPQQERIPYFGLRGVVQKGGLLFGATRSTPDLSHLVVAKFQIAPDLWKTFARPPKILNLARIIPPPKRDLFYSHLLDIKLSEPDRFIGVTRHIREYRLDD